METKAPINLLVIEDESYDVHRIKRTLEPFSDRIVIREVVADGHSAVTFLSTHEDDIDVIIMDYQIAGPLTGENLIRKLKAVDPNVQIIVVTKMTINVTNYDFASRLIEAGAMWFCTKYPADIKEFIYQPTDLILSIFNAYEQKQLKKEKLTSRRQLTQSINNILHEKKIVGESPVLKQLLKHIEKAAQQDATVLICGASGTGKELVATHIHYLSKRKYENFVSINAGSIPEDLVESELFGFTKGSFTGANTHKKGLFEIAHRGTIFLDEISELPLSAQVKLLRVLQEGEIDKIGRTESIKVDVRVIAASNVDLEHAVQANKFREDLFYRLNVIYIYVPTLRERKEDIPLLVHYFLEKYATQMALPKPDVTDEALDALMAYEWPGNIRELQNIVQRLLISCETNITKNDVHNILGTRRIGSVRGPEFWFGDSILPWKEMENLFRIRYFTYVREKVRSDSEAARLLGMAPPNFYRLCHKLGLKK
ncbi:MAG: sigma-54 dependent transcriptional regulator [Bacteroidetes bacterium]|nr:sigma-54 dependent transcriptional regulator [Bacteroidota bacterium]